MWHLKRFWGKVIRKAPRKRQLEVQVVRDTMAPQIQQILMKERKLTFQSMEELLSFFGEERFGRSLDKSEHPLSSCVLVRGWNSSEPVDQQSGTAGRLSLIVLKIEANATVFIHDYSKEPIVVFPGLPKMRGYTAVIPKTSLGIQPLRLSYRGGTLSFSGKYTRIDRSGHP